MTSQRLIGILASIAASAFLAPAAPAQEGETRIVSSELMDLIEAWSDPAASLESLALDARPELIEAYVPFAEDYHGGQALADVFAERLPATWAAIGAAFLFDPAAGAEPPAAAELMAYAMAGEGEEYLAWQQELAADGADFAGFVAAQFPEVIAELEELKASPAEQGIGLLDFAAARGLLGALEEIGPPMHPIPLRDCTCWTVVSFPDQPTPGWALERHDVYARSWGFAPKKREDSIYTKTSRGAVRDIDFWRKSANSQFEVTRDEAGNSSGLRIRMTCTRNDSTSRVCPHLDACEGQLFARLGYASRVYENVDVGGVWSKGAQALTADLARLTYGYPGVPSTTLFVKGIAVAGDYHHGTDSYARANQLFGGQVPLAATPAFTGASSTLVGQMTDPTFHNLAALFTQSGVEGSLAFLMRATWQNPVVPIVLKPNHSHRFDLETASKVYGRGYGRHSETRSNLDSANFMVAVERNYLCRPGVLPPTPRAYWNYSRSAGAPYGDAELQQLVQSFASPMLAIPALPNIGSVPGQYP